MFNFEKNGHFVRNRLPHDLLGIDAIHLVYRLAASIPRREVERIVDWRRRQLDILEAELLELPADRRCWVEVRRRNQISIRYESLLDQALHTSEYGPYHLRKPEIAQIVLDSWKFLLARGEVFVYGVCVMGNHVHVVLSAGTAASAVEDLGGIVGRHKSHTGRLANRLLNRTGLPFWAPDYFDRRIRRGTFLRVMWYVLRNPVAAGLISRWEDWPHTYVHPVVEEMFTGLVREPG